MKLLAISASLYVASAGLGLFAEVLPAAGEIGPFAQLGTAGILAWVVWCLIGELRAARADAAQQREDHNAAFEKSNERWQEQADKDRAVMMQMVQTCSGNRQASIDAAKKRATP